MSLPVNGDKDKINESWCMKTHNNVLSVNLFSVYLSINVRRRVKQSGAGLRIILYGLYFKKMN